LWIFRIHRSSVFQCSVARFTRRIVYSALGLTFIPNSVDDMFGSWIDSFNKTEKNLVLFGCGAVIWRSGEVEMIVALELTELMIRLM
jgi:hypothetical protein